MRTTRLGDLDAVLTGGTDGQGGGDGPVVVLLHGFGAPGTDLVGLEGALEGPKGTRFVFPAAPLELADAGFMFDARAWWPIDMERLQQAMMTGQLRDLTQDEPAGLAAANAAVNGLLDAVERELGVTGDRVVLGGFSQGAMLSCDVALRSERALAGLMLFSGTLLAERVWLPLMPRRAGLKVVQSHGTQDPILPFVLAERLKDSLRGAGLDVRWVPFRGQHEIPRPVLPAASALLMDVLGEGEG